MKITNDIKYVGVNDHQIDLFEGQYKVPHGMSYNSYVILDDQIAVMDSVDKSFGQEWLDNIEKVTEGRAPSYLIVQHMEPDHSSNIALFLSKYTTCKVVASKQAFMMMKNFYGDDYADRQIVVKEGDFLNLGHHNLFFIAAPMVHWPEVMMTYDETEEALFTADAFGKFGALDYEEAWEDEARRYYFGIVGKYGGPVQTLLQKVVGIEFYYILPLHGPVLTGDLHNYIRLYSHWSNYTPEEDGVVIAYCSIYGHTKEAVVLLERELKKYGVKVVTHDLARCDMAEAVADAFKYNKLCLASVTYNADIFPFMKTFINHLTLRNFKNRTVGFIENGSWAPTAANTMKKMLDGAQNLTFLDTKVTIKSSLNDANKEAIAKLAEEFLK